MNEKITLITFDKPKYGEQIVALKNDTGMNLALFDACEIFMEEDTWYERERVKDTAKKFAEQFVSQMNSAHPLPQ